MKRLTLIFFACIYLFSGVLSAYAEAPTPTSPPAYAVCDLCGYCPTNFANKPGDWNKCVECIYPELATTVKDDPTSKDTLKVDPATQNPPTPAPGRMYTMLGCLKTSLTSFQSEGAAVSVVQVLLNIIFQIVGGIAFLYFIYGCYIILTSQADPERLGRGKRTVYGAIVGLVFVLTSILLVRFLASGILKIPGFT